MNLRHTELYRYRTGYLKFRAALCDANTGLLSYPILIDEIHRHFESRESLAVLGVRLLALDRIESIYGWQTVDRLIKQAAMAIQEHMAARHGSGVLVAQDGVHQGRFVILLVGGPGEQPATDLGAMAEAVELKAALEGVFSGPEFATMAQPVGIGCGASFLHENPLVRFERLLARSVEQALGTATAARGDEGHRGEREIRNLLSGEGLRCLFQPVYHLEKRSILGYEALVRGPAGSPLEMPAALFGLGEELGIDEELDGICLRRALESALHLPADRLLFLNTRPPCRSADRLMEQVLSTFMVRTGRQPETVVLEVDERLLQRAGSNVLSDLADLRRLGFRVAVDHAGSGYATLSAMPKTEPV
ncbi:MAG: EAL domain-containing protein, partial [Acidobacteriota bacterium]